MQNGVGTMINAVTGMLGGIFSAMGAKELTESQHLYADDVQVTESSLDKAPYVFGAGAAIALVVALILLFRK